jgi:hypothetical protein
VGISINGVAIVHEHLSAAGVPGKMTMTFDNCGGTTQVPSWGCI